MNYNQTLEWMFMHLPMFQRQGASAFKKDLTNTVNFAGYLGNPELKFKSVHVAGTNGKGSTSHMLASILQESGYKVGLYTSPHLKDFRERIKISGQEIKKREVINFIEKHQQFLEENKLSFFEMTVGMAFDYFAKQQVDVAIIEVGMGGRLDSTNIIIPEVSVITNIGLDHTQFLGETLPEIAFEKAGIIKFSIPVVIGENQPEVLGIFQKIANQKNADLYVASNLINEQLASDLSGNYQVHNIKTVAQTIRILRQKGFVISEEQLKKGLLNVIKNTHLMGRWQQLKKNPKVICDTGHNKDGLKYVLGQLKVEKHEKLHIVVGVVNDKKLDEILPIFPKKAIYYFCKPNIPRGLDAKLLQQECLKYELKGSVFTSVKLAYQEALKKATNKDLVFIGGSTFVVAEVL